MTHVHHLQIGNGANQVWNSPESDAPLALALSTWQPRGPSLRVDLEILKIDAFFFFSAEIDNFQPDYREKWQQKTAQIWQKEEEEEPGILLIVDVDDDDCPFCSMEKPFSRPPPPPPCGKRISAQITPCTNNGGIFSAGPRRASFISSEWNYDGGILMRIDDVDGRSSPRSLRRKKWPREKLIVFQCRRTKGGFKRFCRWKSRGTFFPVWLIVK